MVENAINQGSTEIRREMSTIKKEIVKEVRAYADTV